jgi:hypothetical protein
MLKFPIIEQSQPAQLTRSFIYNKLMENNKVNTLKSENNKFQPSRMKKPAIYFDSLYNELEAQLFTLETIYNIIESNDTTYLNTYLITPTREVNNIKNILKNYVKNTENKLLNPEQINEMNTLNNNIKNEINKIDQYFTTNINNINIKSSLENILSKYLSSLNKLNNEIYNFNYTGQFNQFEDNQNKFKYSKDQNFDSFPIESNQINPVEYLNEVESLPLKNYEETQTQTENPEQFDFGTQYNPEQSEFSSQFNTQALIDDLIITNQKMYKNLTKDEQKLFRKSDLVDYAIKLGILPTLYLNANKEQLYNIIYKNINNNPEEFNEGIYNTPLKGEFIEEETMPELEEI